MSFFTTLQVQLELLEIRAVGATDLIVTVSPLPERRPQPSPMARQGLDVLSYPDFLKASPRYEIRFEEVISYRVTEESYHTGEPLADKEGKMFCRLSKSSFLEFVEANSYGANVNPGHRFHYGIYCLGTCIDVVCGKAPVVIQHP
jgi:hypothetical protein